VAGKDARMKKFAKTRPPLGPEAAEHIAEIGLQAKK
jgi:hypothetical protein